MTVLWELCKPHELSIDQSNGDALLANCAFIAILTALLVLSLCLSVSLSACLSACPCACLYACLCAATYVTRHAPRAALPHGFEKACSKFGLAPKIIIGLSSERACPRNFEAARGTNDYK